MELRELAISKYGCLDLQSVSDGEKEITISYWNNLDDIKRWKQDDRHLLAQKLGEEKWYKSYEVQVVEIIKQYGK